MGKLTVIGMDPSMRNWGLAVAELDLDTLELSNVRLNVLQSETVSKDKKKQVRVSSLDFDCGTDIFKAVMQTMNSSKPSFLFAEMPHGSQSASAMKGYGICLGVMAGIAETAGRTFGAALIQVSESENKKAMGMPKACSKQDMIDAVRLRHPEANWKTRKLKGKDEFVEGWNEHAADAVGAIYAGLESMEFITIRNHLRLMGAA